MSQMTGAGHPQHRALAPLAQVVAKPRVATQFIITRHPAVRHLFAPRVKHLQTLFLSRVISHLQWHMTFLASEHVPCPLLRQGQAEVEQGMVLLRDVAHEDTDLAVVDLAPVATPLPFDPHRMGTPLGETAGIEGNDAIGLAQSAGHLRHQHLDQWSMIPWRGADECLDDLALDLRFAHF